LTRLENTHAANAFLNYMLEVNYMLEGAPKPFA
jgi:hypothetical protein